MSKAIPSKSQSDAIVVIGKLGRPYGVRGWLALQSFTEPRENILAYQPWRIQTGQNSDWVNVGDFLAKPHKDAFIAQINGIEDRDEAARLTGSLIGVSRQVIDVLGQIATAVDAGDPLRETARTAADLVNRGVVAYSSSV